MRNLFIVSLISILGAVAQSDPSTFVMMDGSVSSCSTQEDVGGRAYRLKLITESEDFQMLTIESLICAHKNSKFSWDSIDLGQELVKQYEDLVVKTKITHSDLKITNFEGTEILESIELDTEASVQTIILSDNIIGQSKVSAFLISKTEYTTDDGESDADAVRSGSFVIKLK